MFCMMRMIYYDVIMTLYDVTNRFIVTSYCRLFQSAEILQIILMGHVAVLNLLLMHVLVDVVLIDDVLPGVDDPSDYPGILLDFNTCSCLRLADYSSVYDVTLHLVVSLKSEPHWSVSLHGSRKMAFLVRKMFFGLKS